MPAPYDATTKHLIEMAPEDWLALCGHDVQSRVQVVDADLSTITTMADKVVKVDQPDPWMAHFEFQASYDGGIGLRLLRYNVLIEYRHQLPVQSILILLKPESDGAAAGGVTRRSLPNGTCYYEFRFQTIRVWELSVEMLLAGKIGTLPLAPISDVSVARLPLVLRTMSRRIEQEILPEKWDDFWGATSILMGARYPFPLVDELLQGVINMRESSVAQAFLQEGREDEARRMVLEVAKDRFGEIDPKLKQFVDAISDVGWLERLIIRAGKAASWEELVT